MNQQLKHPIFVSNDEHKGSVQYGPLRTLVNVVIVHKGV